MDAESVIKSGPLRLGDLPTAAQHLLFSLDAVQRPLEGFLARLSGTGRAPVSWDAGSVRHRSEARAKFLLGYRRLLKCVRMLGSGEQAGAGAERGGGTYRGAESGMLWENGEEGFEGGKSEKEISSVARVSGRQGRGGRWRMAPHGTRD